MIKYKKEQQEVDVFDKFICDKCGAEVSDEMDLQEAYSIRFTGGYGSVFGDGVNVSCDLCQDCLKQLIGDFCIME